jgi:hypothetical protein
MTKSGVHAVIRYFIAGITHNNHIDFAGIVTGAFLFKILVSVARYHKVTMVLSGLFHPGDSSERGSEDVFDRNVKSPL